MIMNTNSVVLKVNMGENPLIKKLPAFSRQKNCPRYITCYWQDKNKTLEN
jgi:hypothetical protein